MKNSSILRLLGAALFSLVITSPAFAQNTTRQCVTQANQEADACIRECKQTREDTILACRVPKGSCGDVCKASYYGCIEPVIDQKQACFDNCDAGLDAGRVSCAQSCNCTQGVNCGASSCFADCLDPSAIAHRTCRVSCYRNSDFRAQRRACVVALHSCSRACRRNNNSSSSNSSDDGDSSSSSSSSSNSSSSNDD